MEGAKIASTIFLVNLFFLQGTSLFPTDSGDECFQSFFNKDYQKAKQVCESSLKTQPSNNYYPVILAVTKAKLGNKKGSLSDLSSLLISSPNNPFIYVGFSLVLEDLRERLLRDQMLDQGTKRNPKSAALMEYQNELANKVKFQNEDYQVKYLKMLQITNPDKSPGKFCKFFFENQKYTEAAEICVKLTPND